MTRILLLLLGLLSLAILSFFCINRTQPLIESDLENRATAALALDGIETDSITASGQTVTLTGEVPDAESHIRAEDLVAQLWGVDAVDNQLSITPALPTPDPYVFSLDYDQGKVVLSGYVPDKKSLAIIVSSADAHFGQPNVSNQLKIAPGAPAGFRQTIIEGLIPNISGYQQVTAALSNHTLTVNGKAKSAEHRQKSNAAIKTIADQHFDSTFTVTLPEPAVTNSTTTTENTETETETEAAPTPTTGTDLTTEKASSPEPAVAKQACQKQFSTLLAKQKIRFAINKATIQPESDALLSALATAMEKCPDSHFEIGGHTDASGSEKYNQRLSQKRAEAVKQQLIKRGCQAERLTAKGYGESHPIATNNTPSGMAKNRRIEITLQEEK